MLKHNSFTFTCLWVMGLLSAVVVSDAATYYVAINGSDSNIGSSRQSPFRTITYAAGKTSAGDVVRVQPGTYDERVSLSKSGNSGAWINYVCDGAVVCRGFDLANVNYTRIIGFEITHINTTYDHAIFMDGTCSHLDIVDNYIHDVKGQGVRTGGSSTCTWITMRGNALYYVGHIPGVYNDPGVTGIGNNYVTPHYWLVEYNTIQRSADVFVLMFGTYNIARNNRLWDFKNIYWNLDDSIHSDVFQDGSDGVRVGSQHHLYERNLCSDCTERNSHFGIWQDTGNYGDTNQVIRGNVVYNFGSGGIGVRACSDKVSSYNNTFYNMNFLGTDGYASIMSVYKMSTDLRMPLDPTIANTIIHTTSDNRGSPINIESPSYVKTHNMGFSTYNDSSFVSTSDPKFVDLANRNFRLQSGSPARGTGTNVVWVTSANGSGTSFTVNDPFLFCDGWGMVDGDTITVGKGGTTTVVTNINWGTKTLFVKNSVTWTSGMPVYWGTDTGPDIGALPYNSKELTGATISQSGSTYTVSPDGDARGVWFYVDGIPTTWVSTAPFTATITSGAVTAKAYALYAQSNPVVTAGIGGNTAPSISIQPTTQINVVGQTVTFTVGASGNPAPSYTWQTNNGSGSFVNVASGATLSSWTTPPLAIDMNGRNVRVALTNSQGYVFSDTVRIGVTNGVSPLVSVQPQNAATAVGGTTNFTVVASGGALSYQWRLGGVAIPGATTSVYTINNVDLAANGNQYSVVIGNAWGSITSQVATLTVSDVWYIGNTWTTFGLSNANDHVRFSFDASVSHADADLGIGFSPNAVGDWTALGPIVLFDATGLIYARNGSVYSADNTLTYAPNTWYHISGTANILTHTYSVTVNGAVLASNYAFRTEQAGATQLSNFGANQGYSSLAIVSNLVWTPYVAGGLPPLPPTGLTVGP